MPINEFSISRPRTKIAFIGGAPTQAAIDELAHGWDLYEVDEAHPADQLTIAMTEAAVFVQNPSKPTALLRQLTALAPTYLWNDRRIFIDPAPAVENGPDYRRQIVNALDGLHLPPSGLGEGDISAFGDWFSGISEPIHTPFVHILGKPHDWRTVAGLIQANPAGPSPNFDLSIEIFDEDGRPGRFAKGVEEEQEMLVRRAFHNCRSVRLIRMGNGLSGVDVYKAFALLRQGAVGSDWPYLSFAKIGDRSKVAREFLAYQMNALENVPFHLGPRLRRERCGLAHLQGIVVGDFVAGAQPLRDCARRGTAVAGIGNLFNVTLWAWRQSARSEPTPVQDFLRGRMDSAVPDHRAQLITSFGAKLSSDDIRSLFFQSPSSPVLVGVVHGDLHATNVMLRGDDAILIDMEKIGERMPILFDAASLEGGLFVDGFIGDRRTGQDLLASLEILYMPEAFDRDVAPCHPGDPSAWYFGCVRQIRMQAKQMELTPRQYALVLAAVFFKKACNPEDFSKEAPAGSPPQLSRQEVRALAYIVAERILSRL